MANIVELQHLTKVFPGGVVAVDNVSLQVRESEYLTMLGPSGCGKTTMLRMIGGFEYPDSGRVLLDGQDVTDDPPYRRPLNMMFQDFALFPHLTVAQNIGYGLRMAGWAKADVAREVAESLRKIELPEKANNLPTELSIGQRQRVALARALVRKPKVLLLDEPMSALDAKLRGAMQIELKHLHQQLGLTFIMVTHDQTEALVMSDRVMVMDKGRLVQIGTPTELYDHPGSPYVADFLGNSNMLVAKVSEVRPDAVVARYGTSQIRVAAPGKRPQVGAEVMLCVRPEKIRILLNGQGAPDGFNLLKGTVREQYFHGDSMRMALDIGGDGLIEVHQQLDTAVGRAALPSAGQTVSLALDPACVTLFEEVVTHYKAEDRV